MSVVPEKGPAGSGSLDGGTRRDYRPCQTGGRLYLFSRSSPERARPNRLSEPNWDRGLLAR